MCFLHDLYDLNVIFFLQSCILYKNPCRKTNLNFYKIREISTEKWVSKVYHRLAKRKNSTELGIYMMFDQLVHAQKQFVGVSRSLSSKRWGHILKIIIFFWLPKVTPKNKLQTRRYLIRYLMILQHVMCV